MRADAARECAKLPNPEDRPAGPRLEVRRIDLKPELSRGEALRRLRLAFTQAGLDSPGLDARVLTQHALQIDPAALAAHPEASIGANAATLSEFAARRLAREPVARILGRREFWGLSFALSSATLVPRPETETVVGAVLDRLRDKGRLRDRLSILDLGVGSGCLLVALLTELPNATGLGVDVSADAAGTARANAGTNRVGARARFAVSDWGAAVAGRFDVIVSNPPYIPAKDIGALSAEVRDHDPRLALDGGSDGLAAYRALAGDLGRLLGPAGLVAVEAGVGQTSDICALFAARGLVNSSVTHDLSGTGRVVVSTR